MTSGEKFARNSALNLLGILLPLIVAVAAMPPLVRGLGVERFGILTLAWAAIGYFSLFELGLSRALTQAVAHRIGNDQQHDLPELVWTSLLFLLLLGVAGGIVFAAATDTLIMRILRVPAEFRGEAIVSLYVLAATLPFVVMTAGLRGLMEAHQHFGMATALRMPLVAFTFLGPLMALPFSRSLVPAVVMLAAGRLIGWAAHLVFCLRRYSYLRQRISVSGASIAPLLRYGGWTTVSNVVSPMMVYLDRFLISALLPIAAVTHYVTPYEVVTKLLVVPASIITAMFPAFAATFANDRERMAHLYDRSLRSVVLVMFPVVLITVALAREAMRLWMGNALPPASALVLQVLAVGVFINAIAQPPHAALHAAARPDITAKLHMLELPLYAFLIWILATYMGLVGVAIAWTLRVAVDAALLLLVTQRTLALPAVPSLGSPWTVALMLAAIGAAGLVGGTGVRVVYVVVVGLVFAATAWRRLLSPQERHVLLGWVRPPRTSDVAPTPEGIA